MLEYSNLFIIDLHTDAYYSDINIITWHYSKFSDEVEKKA